jgi:hypothetical protein
MIVGVRRTSPPSFDRPGDQDLGAEPACLLERPARERFAGNT